MPRPANDSTLNDALRHHAAGRVEQAAECYRKVLATQPASAVALRGLALIAHAAGDNTTAADLLARSTALDPLNPQYWFEFGVVLRAVGRLDEAVNALQKAIHLRPTDAQAMGDLRLTYRKQGRAEAAVEFFRQLVAVHPNNAAALNHLGQSLLWSGRMEEGIAVLRECLRLQPGHAHAFGGVADALIYQGRYAEAVQFARDAAQANPERADAWAYMGKGLQRLGQPDAAEQCLRRAIALDPKLASAHNFLGVTLRDLDRIDDAIAAFAEAVRLRPDYADAYNNLGLAHSYAGQPAPALAAYRKAMEVDPDYAEVWGPYLMALNRVSDIDPPEVFEAYRSWARRYTDPLTASAPPHLNDRDPDRRLRIGYLSPDFRGHSVAYFIEPILSSHDRNRFDVVCYANVKAPDAVTERLRGYGHDWRDVVRLTDADLAERIRDDRIDILVDLAGHTTDHRLLVLARRPAPVQVTYLGYPNTTGMRAVDYRLTDATADPPGATEHLHTETLVRLPGCFLCYRPPDESSAECWVLSAEPDGDAPSSPQHSLSTQHFPTFGSFNSFAKVTPEVLELWASVLAAAPGSRLVIKSKGADADAPRRTVAQIMSAHGVDPGRVELVGKQASTAAHLDHYRRIDVALDTFAYNGTTTTCEALWMGVPVVTLAGATHAGRVGASLLQAVRLAEFVAGSKAEYVRIATELASQPARLAEMRRRMRDRLRASSLLDARRFTANLEDAYRSMWRAWCGRASGV